jgi:hypothetical protein
MATEATLGADGTVWSRLVDNVTLYASFADSPNADIARGGNGTASLNDAAVRHEAAGGRTGGGCLVFDAAHHGWAEDEFTFPADGNFPYSSGAFEGTISFWLQGDPDADLDPLMPVDPFHVSRGGAGDGSFYLDLTKHNDPRYGSPRKLRFGFYNDLPRGADPSRGNPVTLDGIGHLLVVGELNWADRKWHHVAATFRQVNSGSENGSAAVFIDGRRRAWSEGYAHSVSWPPEALGKMTIGLGQRYAGKMNELLILDRALSDDEVGQLAQIQGPLHQSAL